MLSIFFPKQCIVCEADGAWLCSTCFDLIQIEEQISPDRVWLSTYSNKVLRRLIHAFKYEQARCLTEVFETLLIKARQTRTSPWPWSNSQTMTIIPIPSDPKHVHQRGFDHTLFLANLVRKTLIPWANLDTQSIIRSSRSHANAELNSNEARQGNVHGAFYGTRAIAGDIVIVDDVCTSGSTADEFTKVLKQMGADKVTLFTFAKG